MECLIVVRRHGLRTNREPCTRSHTSTSWIANHWFIQQFAGCAGHCQTSMPQKASQNSCCQPCLWDRLQFDILKKAVPLLIWLTTVGGYNYTLANYTWTTVIWPGSGKSTNYNGFTYWLFCAIPQVSFPKGIFFHLFWWVHLNIHVSQHRAWPKSNHCIPKCSCRFLHLGYFIDKFFWLWELSVGVLPASLVL